MTEDSEKNRRALAESEQAAGADAEETASTLLPTWLQGQLAQLYADVMREPLPRELLDLVGQLDEQAALRGKGTREAGE